MGAAGAPTAYDQVSASDHDEEAPEETFLIDLPEGLLVEGDNVLAIEVHNVYINSSAAGMIPRLRRR